MSHRSMFLLLLSILSISSCTDARVEPSKPVNQGKLQLPIARVKTQSLSEDLVLPGLVLALPDRSVKVSPGISGKLIDVKASPGDRVKKGQVIAILDCRQLSDVVNETHARVLVAKANVEQVKANFLLAKNTAERNERLVEQDVGAQKDLIAAKSQVETAKAQVSSAEAQVDDTLAAEEAAKAQLSYANVKSPIEGEVAQRYLNISDSADTSTPILQIVDLTKVIIEASLPTTQPARVDVGTVAAITGKSIPGVEVSGRVVSINPVTDNQGTTIGVRILCDNNKGYFKEGMPVTVTLRTREHLHALSIPSSAIVADPETPGDKMVYVFRDNKVSRVKVKLGIERDGVTEVLSGLTAGERIVAAGAYGVPDGTEVEPEDGAIHATSQVPSESN